MCRSKAESGRRCPCSLPERRSAADRARYAARKAAGMTAPGQTHPAPQQLPAVPSAEAIEDRINLLQQALDTTAPANSHEDLEAYDRWREEHQRAGEALQEWTGATDGLDARERAVVKIGAMVAERAEFHAGVTADELQTAWQARAEEAQEQFEAARAAIKVADEEFDQALDERNEARQDLWDVQRNFPEDSDAFREALAIHDDRNAALSAAGQRRAAAYDASGYYSHMERHRLVESGRDEETQEGLRRLAEGYRTALAEIRDLGGELTWHEKTPAKAKQFFDPAAQHYPSDWIATSNLRAAPVGKVTRSRAHYIDGTDHVSRKKVPVTSVFHIRRLEQVKESYPAPYYRHEVVTDASGTQTVVVTHMERYSHYTHRMKNGKPTGGGWEQTTYTDHRGEQDTTWWRPQTRMKTVASTFAPEITTDGSASTSIHELAHRMEASVPQIGQMEARWVARRTTIDGVRDETQSYRPGSKREKVRPDDFIDRYIGKDYGTTTYHEVLSMGAPMLFAGDRGGMVGVGRNKRDDDMRAFILGCMASAKAPQQARKGLAR